MALLPLDLRTDWLTNYNPAAYRHAGKVFLQGSVLWGGIGDPDPEILATPLPPELRPAVDTTFLAPSDPNASDFPQLWLMTARTDGQLVFTGRDPRSPNDVPAGATTPTGQVFDEIILELGTWDTADADDPASLWHQLPDILEPDWSSTLQYRRHSPADDGRVEWRGVLTGGPGVDVVNSPNGLPEDIRPEPFDGFGRRIPLFAGDDWWAAQFYESGVVRFDNVGSSYRPGIWFQDRTPLIGSLSEHVTDNIWDVEWSDEMSDVAGALRSRVDVMVIADLAGPRYAAAGLAWGEPGNWLGVVVTRTRNDTEGDVPEPEDLITWIRIDLVGGPIPEQGGAINILAQVYTRQVVATNGEGTAEAIQLGLEYINDPDDPDYQHWFINLGPNQDIDLGVLDHDLGGRVGYVRDSIFGDTGFDQINLVGQDFYPVDPPEGSFDFAQVGWYKPPSPAEGRLTVEPGAPGTRPRGRVIGSGHRRIVL